MTAISAALVFDATYFLRFPLPTLNGAYVNLGDCVIFLTAFLLGGLPAAIAGSLGATIADLLAGAAVYAPATAIIKFFMGLVASHIYRAGRPKAAATATVVGGAIMASGYAVYEFFLFGSAYALASLPMNILQAACAGSIAVILYPALDRLKGTV